MFSLITIFFLTISEKIKFMADIDSMTTEIKIFAKSF